MSRLRISIIQKNLAWEDKVANLSAFGEAIQGLEGTTDIVVLPETFSTGFSMNANDLAEDDKDETLEMIKQWAGTYDLAICGSFIAREKGEFYNRAFFITPQDSYYYNKRHLFRMGGEQEIFSPGKEKTTLSYKGWNIRLAVCYDLRFPVWLRNKGNEYDLLIVPANWPEARNSVWETLLKARAIENQSYVCGVNRIGDDSTGIPHAGNSMLVDYKGNLMISAGIHQENILTVEIDKENLDRFRIKFPVWKDADHFEIE
ncbi:nitrilase family protein [Bacteroidales bacterium OttesenSCG-928-L03]|nr:nitrilase family protein [Bacteroidales bacterium OttesenSCG-928-L03]